MAGQISVGFLGFEKWASRKAVFCLVLLLAWKLRKPLNHLNRQNRPEKLAIDKEYNKAMGLVYFTVKQQ